jgi:Ca2+-binding RTX toxin-like protein
VPVGSGTAAVTDTNPSFEVSVGDLKFILKQIRISEAHKADGNLLCTGADDGTCVPDAKLPWGLRTVDGRFNNLMPGQSDFGSSDQPFKRLLPSYDWTTGTGEAYPRTGDVVDASIRTISNLIVDQTTRNPAAVETATGANPVPGSTVDEDGTIFIPNEAPDEGLSAPFNSWMTIFGQFFDHGLDLVDKGGAGTVTVPLNADDPLMAVPGPPGPRQMTLTRATVTDPDGARSHNNETTPFVDQNQTYTSHPSHQVFLREYEATASGPHSTGELLDGINPVDPAERQGLASWKDVKDQARTLLGIELSDQDVLNVPRVLTDFYGQFQPGPNGYPQLVVQQETDTEPAVVVEGDPANPVSPSAVGALRTDHAFLDDIAHTANPAGKVADDDTDVNGPAPRPAGTFDNELLETHFITGDGRGNENIGLSAVHHVFHAEHNRLSDSIHELIQGNAQLKEGFEAQTADPDDWEWTYGDRLFQAARYVTEMEYQHLVFEEFGRTLSPTIDPAPFNESTYHTDIDAAIPAEFAHVVYRFGHSMLNDTLPRRGFGTSDISLFNGFLNPPAFTNGGTLSPDQAAGSLVNGLVAQTGNGIDEFVDDTLRNQLLGQPLDLATLNMARARETGTPPLQTVRAWFHDQTGDPALRPYEDWADFEAGLKHPASLVNFVAAYAVPENASAPLKTVAERRTEAAALIAEPGFMASSTGLDRIDFWVGGLAEEGMPFGGMLGSTFNQVFERTLENLQNGDRFYYLNRNIGLNLFHQLEANSFSALVQRTTAASEVPTNIFASQDGTVFDLEVIVPAFLGGTALPEGLTQMGNGTYRYIGGDHIQMHGQRTADDKMRGDVGDDALWGYGGDDRIEGEAGNDQFVGGPGNDVLTDLFGDDNIKGSSGHDAIHAGPGLDLIHGGGGDDFVVHGEDDTQTFAGQGDDKMIGGNAHDIFAGNEGDDWIESGGGSDLVQGDNANGFQDDPFGGNDILISGPGNDDYDSEGGDDIMLTDQGTDRHEGMLGFDWVTHKGDPFGANADMDNTVFQPPSVQNMRDRYDLVEALSGWQHDDVLRGVSNVDVPPSILGDAVCAELGRPAGCTGHELTQTHLDMVEGLEELLGGTTGPFLSDNTTNDILIGGEGSDLIEGRGGNDFIDGDAWLDVKLVHNGTEYDSLAQLRADVFKDTGDRIIPDQIGYVRRIVTPPADSVAGDVNTAVFTGEQGEYDIVDNGDGTITVTHSGGTQVDGTDVLRNIQRLEFLDNSQVDVEDVLNTPATGVLALSTLAPVQDEEIAADPTGLSDLDGIDEQSLVVTFQAAEVVDGEPVFNQVGTGETFTPGEELVGLRLRAVATFTDGDGTLEQVVSDVTEPVAAGQPGPGPDPEPVNTPAAGAPSIIVDGAALRVVTSQVSDADGMPAPGALGFQWQRENAGGFADIAGATGPQLRVTDGLRGSNVRVVVSFTDAGGAAESLTSSAMKVPTSVAGKPRITKVVPGARGGKSTARVQWLPPVATGGLPVTGYRVQAVRTPGTWRKAVTVPANRRGLTMALPRAGYRFTVQAINADGTSKTMVSRVVRAR